MAHSKEQNTWAGNMHEEAQTPNLLDKVFKTTVLERTKELKADMDKERQIIYGQDEDLNKDV